MPIPIWTITLLSLHHHAPISFLSLIHHAHYCSWLYHWTYFPSSPLTTLCTILSSPVCSLSSRVCGASSMHGHPHSSSTSSHPSPHMLITLQTLHLHSPMPLPSYPLRSHASYLHARTHSSSRHLLSLYTTCPPCMLFFHWSTSPHISNPMYAPIPPIPCMHPWPSSPWLRTHIHPSYTTTPAAIAHPLFIPITTHAHPSIKHTHLTHFFILHTHFYYHHSLSTPPCTMSSLSLH